MTIPIYSDQDRMFYDAIPSIIAHIYNYWSVLIWLTDSLVCQRAKMLD